jgi:hypothetical protein
MNHQQSFLKVRLSSPIKFGALSAPKPTRFGGNGKASRNAIVLFSKKPNLILHIFSDFFLLNLTHATRICLEPKLTSDCWRADRELFTRCKYQAFPYLENRVRRFHSAVLAMARQSPNFVQRDSTCPRRFDESLCIVVRSNRHGEE